MWQWLGLANQGGNSSSDRQAPPDWPTSGWEQELQALQHVAFLVALSKSSLWTILQAPWHAAPCACAAPSQPCKLGLSPWFSSVIHLVHSSLLSVFRSSGSPFAGLYLHDPILGGNEFKALSFCMNPSSERDITEVNMNSAAGRKAM